MAGSNPENSDYIFVEDGDGEEQERILVGLDGKEKDDLFNSFSDTGDSKGTVELGQVEFMFRCLGFSDFEAKEKFAKFKASHKKNYLVKSDFKKLIAPTIPEWPDHNDVKEAFRVFDQDGLNYIHVNQLRRFIQAALGNTQLDEKVEQLIEKACEQDGDGLINYEEFVDKIQEKYEGTHPPPPPPN